LEICLTLMQLTSLEAEQVAGKDSVFSSPSLVIIALCTLSFFLEMIPGIGDVYFNAFILTLIIL